MAEKYNIQWYSWNTFTKFETNLKFKKMKQIYKWRNTFSTSKTNEKNQIYWSVTVCIITKRKNYQKQINTNPSPHHFYNFDRELCQHGIRVFTYACVHSWKLGKRLDVTSYFSLGWNYTLKHMFDLTNCCDSLFFSHLWLVKCLRGSEVSSFEFTDS